MTESVIPNPTPQAADGRTRKRSRRVESLIATTWGKLLVPSLPDLFFLALLAWLFVAGPFGWIGLLSDGDAGWHIRTGEFILSRHTIPHHDLYSFSKPGAPWYAWEWLSDVLYAWLYRLAGFKALVLAAGVVIAGTATLLFRRIAWQGGNFFLTLAVTLVAVGASSMHFLARPHIFTLLLLAISLWMIESDRRAPGWRIWLLVPLTALWTNLHGGFPALIAYLLLLAAGSAVENLWLGRGTERRWFAPRRYGLLAAACGLASLANPYGVRLDEHIIAYLRSDWIRSVVQEFQSPNFRHENVMQFEVLLLAGLVVAGAMLVRGHVTEALWIVAFGHLALQSVRHAPVFALVAAPVVAVEATRWWNHWAAKAKSGSLFSTFDRMASDFAPNLRRTSVWCFAAVAVLAMLGAPLPWPKDFPSQLFPTAIVHRHAAELAGARVLTTDQWADYLIFVNYPRQRVFVDGRSDFYGPQIGNQYLRLMQGQWDWEQILKRNDFDLALLPVEWPLSSMLKQDPKWRVVEDDGQAVMFVRSLP